MINCNGELLTSETEITNTNRGFLYGDAVFETLKIVNGKILFLEDHYFRLMAAIRIVRMEIPMNFTMEYFEEQLLNLAKANHCVASARARITIYRDQGGLYLPENNTISFIIHVSELPNQTYLLEDTTYEVDLFKDYVITKQLLSTIKTTNKMINVVGSIYANENDLQNCLLLNNEKNVVEALNGNLFLLLNSRLITPPINDGCINGIIRRQVLEIAKKIINIEVIEESISPFDLQKADELFITNIITGIQPITKYRKKEYTTLFSKELIVKLNALIS